MLHLAAFTGDLNNAQSAGDYKLELIVNGTNNSVTLPDLPGEEKSRARGDLWKLNISSFGFKYDCIHKKDIEEIAIQEKTIDAWHIKSVILLLQDTLDQFYIVSIGININQWLDGDLGFDTAVKRYTLPLS